MTLRARNLSVALADGGETVRGASFEVGRGDAVGLVGESGCGKSMTALAVMGLLPDAARVSGGQILLDGEDLLALPAAARRLRMGRDIAMIFQEPMTSLNPVQRVGDQIAESVARDPGVGRRAARARAEELLEMVRMPRPAERLRAYPHELSGGQRQRVMIAVALARRPRVLIADEPTTALDATVQSRILALLDDLRSELGMSLLLITHDFGVVAEITSSVLVMYRGEIVESAPTDDLLRAPRHPYAFGLMRCIPVPERAGSDLPAIPGRAPPPNERVDGCAFSGRCFCARDKCRREAPTLSAIAPKRTVKCFFPVASEEGESAQ